MMKFKNPFKNLFSYFCPVQTLSDKQKALLDLIDNHLMATLSSPEHNSVMKLHAISIPLALQFRSVEEIMQRAVVNLPKTGGIMPRGIALVQVNTDWTIIVSIREPGEFNSMNEQINVELFCAALHQTNAARRHNPTV